MQIICVSRGSQSRGKEFAEKLAARLGYACISREDLLEEATRLRIPVGKLETAIIKPRIYSETLAVEVDHYKALATSILCEKALSDNIVYHGRTGHLLLPGIDHVLRIRVVSDMAYRVSYVMHELGLTAEQAKRYIEQVEDDRRKWVKTFYNVEWDVFTLYDLVLNLSQMNVDNAASSVCSMAQLPEFQATPVSLKALKDLLLASKVRLALAFDSATRDFRLKVRAADGVVHVTYLSQEVKNPDLITAALSEIEDAHEIVCTEAQTNILWIQEAFAPDPQAYREVLSLAKMWDAAIELVKLMPGTEAPPVELKETAKPFSEGWPESGVFEESDRPEASESEDMSEIYKQLINDGRAGGRRNIPCTQKSLIGAIDRSVNYRLIVFDNVFLAKGTEARKRQHREWSNLLADTVKTPVVTLGEIVSTYRFGSKQAVRMAVFSLLTALIVYTVFHFDVQVLTFLSAEGFGRRVLATLAVFVFVPTFALMYSTATRLFLKMIKLD